MAPLWFWLVALMLAAYVIFDGFDLGAGVAHLFAARTEAERAAILRSVGPVWDGNEVWLLASGGTLFFAFPALYAASFSGFYLALTIVLWLLVLRGISIEFRNLVASLLWKQFWDIVFGASSGLLALLYGVALGNVVRGVPLDAKGYFFLPLWTSFKPEGNAGIADWYTLLVGLASLSALAWQGSLWVALKTAGDLRLCIRVFAGRSGWATLAMTLLITPISFFIQPHLGVRFREAPFGAVFPLLAAMGLASAFFFHRASQDGRAFLGSCLYLLGMLASVVFGVYPYVLPSNVDSRFSLTVFNASAPEYGLRVGLLWWVPALLLVAAYFVFAYRQSRGRIAVEGVKS